MRASHEFHGSRLLLNKIFKENVAKLSRVASRTVPRLPYPCQAGVIVAGNTGAGMTDDLGDGVNEKPALMSNTDMGPNLYQNAASRLFRNAAFDLLTDNLFLYYMQVEKN